MKIPMVHIAHRLFISVGLAGFGIHRWCDSKYNFIEVSLGLVAFNWRL